MQVAEVRVHPCGHLGGEHRTILPLAQSGRYGAVHLRETHVSHTLASRSTSCSHHVQIINPCLKPSSFEKTEALETSKNATLDTVDMISPSLTQRRPLQEQRGSLLDS